MGKSDPIIFSHYLDLLDQKEKLGSVGFFGQSGENYLSSQIVSSEKYFYDLSLKNWNINKFPYAVDKKFDLIVCTRCAYFCKDPKRMLESFRGFLKPGGKILIDWGLGDHWRFKNFKVGWLKSGEQEWAYEKDNFLWSSIWDLDLLSKDKNYPIFKEACLKLGYEEETFESDVSLEIPVKIETKEISGLDLKIFKYRSIFLWPSEPQFYMSFILEAT